MHYLQHGKIGNFVLEQPMCLGHESSGTVAKLGPGVKESTGLKEGMRVALEPGVSCRTCGVCKSGAYEVSLRSFPLLRLWWTATGGGWKEAGGRRGTSTFGRLLSLCFVGTPD